MQHGLHVKPYSIRCTACTTGTIADIAESLLIFVAPKVVGGAAQVCNVNKFACCA